MRNALTRLARLEDKVKPEAELVDPWFWNEEPAYRAMSKRGQKHIAGLMEKAHACGRNFSKALDAFTDGELDELEAFILQSVSLQPEFQEFVDNNGGRLANESWADATARLVKVKAWEDPEVARAQA